MQLNAEFDQRALVHSRLIPWLDSPMPGVARRQLDRVGGEVARATSIVRYAPGSEFSPHTHAGGEEIFVLEGVFQDEQGDFPAGSYIRNPPQSRHTPSSSAGCVIFVKLWQFEPDDQTSVVLNSNFMAPVPHRHLNAVSVVPLFKNQYEEVSLQVWEPNSTIEIAFEHGAEFLVLEGGFSQGGDVLTEQSWLRLPVASALIAMTSEHGARVWVKQNHLSRVQAQVERLSVCD